MLLLNTLLLMIVAFLPFATSVLAGALDSGHGLRTAVVFYGIAFDATALTFNVVWQYARRHQLLSKTLDAAGATAIGRRFQLALAWLTTGALLFFYWVPVAGFFNVQRPIQIISAVGVAAMVLSFIPTLKYYGRSWTWALLLPVIATLYLLMTWTSAVRYWRGNRAEWKGRSYAATSPRSSHHQSGTASP